jgi:phosphopantothenate synthetase
MALTHCVHVHPPFVLFVARPGVSDAGECFHYLLSESGKDDEIAAAAAAAAGRVLLK